MQFQRSVHLTVRNRAAAVALGAAVIVVAGVLFALGLTLLLGMATVGIAAGAATMLYRRLTRGRRGRPVPGLDPSMEVFPRDASVRELRAPRGD